MITIATHLWDANRHSFSFSTMYDESWVEKLYRGFARNLTQPFRFICWSEKPRTYAEPIEQRLFNSPEPDYGSCIQVFELGVPMIVCGLDTVITGNVDHLAAHCLDTVITGNVDHLAAHCVMHRKLALPRDPNRPFTACNGVVLCPGDASLYTEHDGRNDMAWMRSRPHVFIDDLFPGQVRSWKGSESPQHSDVKGVRETGLQDTRIVYFHGNDKPHEITESWLLDHWV